MRSKTILGEIDAEPDSSHGVPDKFDGGSHREAPF
jgi:hypothetical protein